MKLVRVKSDNMVLKMRKFLVCKYILLKKKIGKIFNIYYIGGSDILPPPLTNDEENKLLNEDEKRR